MATSLLLILLLFSFTNAALSTSDPISGALETLYDSGYFSMALTIQITSSSLNLPYPNLTIFAPSDQAFEKSGQPSLIDLQYQISVQRIPRRSLKNLLYGARIPALRPNASLIVTEPLNFGRGLSINDVPVNDAPIFDDGYLVIYGADDFFGSSIPITLGPTPSPQQAPPVPTSLEVGDDVFDKAANFLTSRGYIIMGAFLGMQLQSSAETRFTVFAPVDEAISLSVSSFSNYSTIFRAHVVPQRLLWSDLQSISEWTLLSTASKGFRIDGTWSGDILLLNGAPVIFPDMYVNDRIVIHGLNRLLVSWAEQESIDQSFSELSNEDEYHQFGPDDAEYNVR